MPKSKSVPASALRCRRKFIRIFPEGFRDPTYLDWERNYKAKAHARWMESLAPSRFRSLLRAKRFSEIAGHAVRIESRTNLLFSFEKMALRDAVRARRGAQIFAEGLFDFLHGRGALETKFARWCDAVGSLPRRQTRVLTWPVVTVFPFIAIPAEHVFLKPNVTRIAARNYGYEFEYRSRPNWESYASLRGFASLLRRDLRDLAPRDMIDIQSFIWIQGSDEYEEE